MPTFRRLFPFSLATALAVSTLIEARDTPIEEGRVFPEVPFTALEDGAARHLSDFRGQKLILHVFASW